MRHHFQPFGNKSSQFRLVVGGAWARRGHPSVSSQHTGVWFSKQGRYHGCASFGRVILGDFTKFRSFVLKVDGPSPRASTWPAHAESVDQRQQA
jgi:hypothetical protein